MSAQYFAKLNENNVVIDVAVVTTEFMAENPERYLGTWVETFIDDTHTYAGIGFIYDYDAQDFIQPEPIEPDIEQ